MHEKIRKRIRSRNTPDAGDNAPLSLFGSLNGIFDFDVASVCAPSGTMLDVHDGKFMYEHIISSLTGLYENNLAEEYKKMNERINQKTAKYRGKKQ